MTSQEKTMRDRFLRAMQDKPEDTASDRNWREDWCESFYRYAEPTGEELEELQRKVRRREVAAWIMILAIWLIAVVKA